MIPRAMHLFFPFLISLIIFFIMRIWLFEILLFESIILSCILGLFVYLIFFILKDKLFTSKSSRYYEGVISILLSSLMFYSFSLSTLLNIDRSKSLHVINWVYNFQPINEYDLQVKISKKFGEKEYDSYESRILEQVERGIITSENNKYTLSFIGNLIWQVANFLAKAFHLSGWNNSDL